MVDDAGPGVPATALPHLFERFYRAPRRQGSRSEGGSGIGLAVVRGLAEAMGGSVIARPSALGGLSVVVRLPVDGERKPAEGAIEPEVVRAVKPAAEGAIEPEVVRAVAPAAEGAIGGEVEGAVEPAAKPSVEPESGPSAPAVELPVEPSFEAEVEPALDHSGAATPAEAS
jgi:hypothetical protein